MYCSLVNLHQRLPALADIIIDKLKMIIFFEILQPEKFLPAIGIHLTLDEILGLNKADLIKSNEEEIDLTLGDPDKNNSLKKLRFILIVVGLAMGGMMIAFVLVMCCKKFRDKLLDFAKTTIKSFIWNNTIQTVYISYLPQGIQMTTAFVNTWRE